MNVPNISAEFDLVSIANARAKHILQSTTIDQTLVQQAVTTANYIFSGFDAGEIETTQDAALALAALQLLKSVFEIKQLPELETLSSITESAIERLERLQL